MSETTLQSRNAKLGKLYPISGVLMFVLAMCLVVLGIATGIHSNAPQALVSPSSKSAPAPADTPDAPSAASAGTSPEGSNEQVENNGVANEDTDIETASAAGIPTSSVAHGKYQSGTYYAYDAQPGSNRFGPAFPHDNQAATNERYNRLEHDRLFAAHVKLAYEHKGDLTKYTDVDAEQLAIKYRKDSNKWRSDVKWLKKQSKSSHVEYIKGEYLSFGMVPMKDGSMPNSFKSIQHHDMGWTQIVTLQDGSMVYLRLECGAQTSMPFAPPAPKPQPVEDNPVVKWIKEIFKPTPPTTIPPTPTAPPTIPPKTPPTTTTVPPTTPPTTTTQPPPTTTTPPPTTVPPTTTQPPPTTTTTPPTTTTTTPPCVRKPKPDYGLGYEAIPHGLCDWERAPKRDQLKGCTQNGHIEGGTCVPNPVRQDPQAPNNGIPVGHTPNAPLNPPTNTAPHPNDPASSDIGSNAGGPAGAPNSGVPHGNLENGSGNATNPNSVTNAPETPNNLPTEIQGPLGAPS